MPTITARIISFLFLYSENEQPAHQSERVGLILPTAQSHVLKKAHDFRDAVTDYSAVVGWISWIFTGRAGTIVEIACL